MTANAKLTEAVAAVMREIHRLKKDETNKHGGYKYVSVDDVKDHVRPLLGKHGIEVTLSESDYSIETIQGKNGTSVCAKITYDIRLRHVSGECGDIERLTVLLPYTGAQTTGAARSYAIKEYIKSRFFVSTGEKDMIEGGVDADNYAPQEYTRAPSRPPSQPVKVETQKPAEGLADTILRKFNEAETAAAFEELVQRAQAKWSSLGTGDKARVSNAIEARRAFWAQSPALEAAE